MPSSRLRCPSCSSALVIPGDVSVIALSHRIAIVHFLVRLSHRDMSKFRTGTVFAHLAPSEGPGREEVLTNVRCCPHRMPTGLGWPCHGDGGLGQLKVTDMKGNRKGMEKQREMEY